MTLTIKYNYVQLKYQLYKAIIQFLDTESIKIGQFPSGRKKLEIDEEFLGCLLLPFVLPRVEALL